MSVKRTMANRILPVFLSLLMATGALFAVGASPVSASDTIYLGSDGWSVPVGTWDSASRTAVLTQDISSSIVITSDYIVLDGNGYTISGDGSGDGVYAESKHHLTIRNLTITDKQNGVKMYKTHNSVVENNTISNTERGIYLYEGALISVLNNQTFSNSYAGISVRAYSRDNIIEDNESYLNHTGIKFEGGFFNTVRNNDMRDNTAYGLTITDDWGFIGMEFVRFVTNDNQIYNNNFINNPTQAFVYTWLVGENNVFYLDLPAGGNYWSNWTSPDENQDGLVDNPYVLYGVQDNLPWAALNGWLNPLAPNQPPVADVGGPYSTVLGNTVTFDGSGSYDPDAATGDTIVSYEWDIAGIYALDGSSPSLTAEDINALGVGTHSVSLMVTDSFRATHTDSTALEVMAPPTDILEDTETLILAFDEAVSEGTLTGMGPGKSAGGRLGALRNMLVSAYNLIQDNQYEQALEQLQNAYHKVDGSP